MDRNKRITNALGQVLMLSMVQRAGGLLRMQRMDGDKPEVIEIDRTGAMLLQGFITSVRLAGKRRVESEEVDDAHRTRLEYALDPVPAIRVTQGTTARTLDIDAPFWDALYVELGLTIPRMQDVFPTPGSMLH